jgi:hypothetical protein
VCEAGPVTATHRALALHDVAEAMMVHTQLARLRRALTRLTRMLRCEDGGPVGCCAVQSDRSSRPVETSTRLHGPETQKTATFRGNVGLPCDMLLPPYRLERTVRTLEKNGGGSKNVPL